MKTYIAVYINISNEIKDLDKKKHKSLEDLEKMETLMGLHSEVYDVLADTDANKLRPLINPFVPEEYRI